jgi:CPA1 family monovalent cation:H+ antiporter
MEQFLRTETLIIELLLVVTLVAIVVRRFRIPYTVALVVAGLLITLQQPVQIDLTPELILALFVPPLVFDAAFHISFNDLRRSLPSILLLAVPGVIITTLIVGGIVSYGAAMTLSVALVFGALIAATDPISVVAMFRHLGISKRLSVLVEGESLFNDGTSIVLYTILLAAALTGQFSLLQGTADFVRVSVGGVAVGLLLGWFVSWLIHRLDDYLIETTLTTLVAYGSYLLAERFGFSGVLAVVMAGLVNGNIGPSGMSPTTRIVIANFWEYVAFIANSMIFLLIGLDINLAGLLSAWQPVVWAIGGILLARAVVVFGFGWIINRFIEPFPVRWQVVLGWGGLRGAVSLALALSLPAALGSERDLLQLMTFGVVLFTLLGQATTMQPLLRWLKIGMRSQAQVEYEMRHARLVAVRSAEKHLQNLHSQGLVSVHTMEQLMPELERSIDGMTQAVREVMRAEPELEAEELDTVLRELLRAQRSALMGLRRDGVISDEVFEKLTAEVDAALLDPQQSLFINDQPAEYKRGD